MRVIRYTVTDFHAPDEEKEGILADFVLDALIIPHAGVMLPLHLLNDVLRQGGGDGGMGPGCIWDPFEIDETEYQALIQDLEKRDSEELRERAQLREGRVIIDTEFNDCRDHIEWLTAVSGKYRHM
ncbi:MAG TPA: hypothetical protein VK448_07565 [Dissulfurispiraceae bacterium]|nr:hypothetical protein [Dissulfurispiraceae bacterium]